MSATASPTAETQAAWDLILRFARDGDPQASFALYEQLQSCLPRATSATNSNGVWGNPVNVLYTLPPTMLRECLNSTNAPPAAFLLVCVLNRMFCLTVVPAAMAQALDRRPGGLTDLLGFYLAALAARPDMPAAAQRQIAVSVACLALLTYDDIMCFLWEAQRSAEAGQTPITLLCLLLAAVMDVLGDSRVPLGPLRRATQRRRLQANLHVVFLPDLANISNHGGSSNSGNMSSGGNEDATWLPQVQLLDKAVSFLLEGMTGEPQEVAASFWRVLASTPVWGFVVHCYTRAACSSGDDGVGDNSNDGEVSSSLLPATVVDCACSVLRCVTVVDAPAAQLLESLMQPAMALVSVRGTCAAACATLAAVLEAATEDVVLRSEPSDGPFQLISAAAEQLVRVLRTTNGIPIVAVLSACEGVGALAQVLAPMAIPPMEPDDDAEDYACVAQAMASENADKAAAVGALRGFLTACQQVLLERLVGPLSVVSADDCEAIAAHLRRREGWGRRGDLPIKRQPSTHLCNRTHADGCGGGGSSGCGADDALEPQDEEDFQVAFDEVPLAVFATYERLCRLLGGPPKEAWTAAQSSGLLAGVCTCAEASLAVLTASGDPIGAATRLLAQAPLLPVVTGRFSRVRREEVSQQLWPPAAWPAVVSALTACLEAAAAEQQLRAATHAMRAAGHVVAAAVRLTRYTHKTGGISTGTNGTAAAAAAATLYAFTGSLEPLLAAAWRCLHLPGPQTDHWRLAENMAAFLDSAGPAASVPQHLLSLLSKQDAHTQAVLLAARPVQSTETFMYVLRCLQELVSSEEEAAMRWAGWQLARRAVRLLRLPQENGAGSDDDCGDDSVAEGAQPPPLSPAACEAYACMLDRWHAEHPAMLELAVLLAEPLPDDLRARLRAVCVLRCLERDAVRDALCDADIPTEPLDRILRSPCLKHPVATDLGTLMDTSLTTRLGQLVALLLRPHPAYLAAGAEARLLSLAQLTAATARTRRLPGADVAALLEMGVQRLKDLVAAQGMTVEAGFTDGGDEDSDEDGGARPPTAEEQRDRIVEELAAAAVCALYGCQQEGSLPLVFQPLLNAADEYEMRSILRGLVGL